MGVQTTAVVTINSNQIPKQEVTTLCGNTPIPSVRIRSKTAARADLDVRDAEGFRVPIRNSWQLSCAPAFGPYRCSDPHAGVVEVLRL